MARGRTQQVMAVRRTGDATKKFPDRVIVEEPLEIVRDGSREEALAENLRRYVAILERYVSANPEQWYCFYPFWEDPSRRAVSADG